MGRKKGVVLSYILMVFEVLSTLLLTPLIIRTLGQAEYGVYKLSLSVIAYLALLDMGVGNAIVRYTAKYKERGDKENLERFFGVSQLYYVVVAGIAGVIGSILIDVFPKMFAVGLSTEEIWLGQKLLAITLINTVVTLGTSVFNNIIIGHGLFGVSRGASIIQIVFRMIATFVALRLGFKSVALVSIQLILTIVCRGCFGIYVFTKLKLRPRLRGVKKSFVFEIIGYSTWILLQMIATQVNAFADQILLGALVPAASVIIAVYGVGIQIVQYFQSLGTAIGGVLFPGVVSLIERGADAKTIQGEMIKIGRIVFMFLGVVWCGFLLYGKSFIGLWAGEENINGFYVAAILMFAHMIIQIEAIGTQILWAKNEHKEQAILKLVIVLLNILLTILLIQWNPLLGATIGTLISYLLGDVLVMNVIFKRKIGISLKEYYCGLLKGIFAVLLITSLIGIGINRIQLAGWLGLFCKVILFCIVYCVLIYKFGWNAYEKGLVCGTVKCMFRKCCKK